MKKKLCFVIQSLEIGGSSRLVHDLVLGITPQSFDVYLIVFFNKIADQYSDLPKVLGNHFIVLHKRKTVDIPFMKRLKKTLQSIKPDIVSSHLTCIFYLNFFLNYKTMSVFHTIHNKPSADLPWPYRFVLSPNIHRGKIHLVGCSNYVAIEGQKLYHVRVVPIQNGIVLPNQNLLPRSRQYSFLCVGRFTAIKRFTDLVKAFALVHQKIPSATLCICGYGPEKGNILLEIKRQGLTESVFVFDQTTAVSTLYSNSKIFCLFSSREGAPIAILEALSWGIPVVATEVNGVPDFVKDGYNGFLFRTGDIEKAAFLMNAMLSNDEQFSRMSKQALDSSKNFSIEKTIDLYTSLFNGRL